MPNYYPATTTIVHLEQVLNLVPSAFMSLYCVHLIERMSYEMATDIGTIICIEYAVIKERLLIRPINCTIQDDGVHGDVSDGRKWIRQIASNQGGNLSDGLSILGECIVAVLSVRLNVAKYRGYVLANGII